MTEPKTNTYLPEGRRDLGFPASLGHGDRAGADRRLDLEVIDRADLVVIHPLTMHLVAPDDGTELGRALKERVLPLGLQHRTLKREVVGRQLGRTSGVAGGETIEVGRLIGALDALLDSWAKGASVGPA